MNIGDVSEEVSPWKLLDVPGAVPSKTNSPRSFKVDNLNTFLSIDACIVGKKIALEVNGPQHYMTAWNEGAVKGGGGGGRREEAQSRKA